MSNSTPAYLSLNRVTPMLKRVSFAVLLCGLAAAFAASGCDSFKVFDEPAGLVIYDAGTAPPPDGAIRAHRPVLQGEIAPVYGFVSPTEKVEYYYLGEVDRVGEQIPVNPIYFFYDENGKPLFRLSKDGSRLVGWHPVVNIVPTRTGYSPFWRVHKVRVKGNVDQMAIEALATLPALKDTCQMNASCPDDKVCIEDRCTDPIEVGALKLDSVKSFDTLKESRLLISETDTIVNCPIVDADAKLLKGIANPDRPFPKVQLWYKRLKAFCYFMEGAQALLGDGAGNLGDKTIPPVADAYFIRRELSFDTDESVFVLPDRHLVLTEHLPGTSGYSPLVRELTVLVGKDHEFTDLRSVAEAKAQGLPIVTSSTLHNLAVRGTIPACKTDEDCADTGGKVDAPLKCSVEQGYCSPPFARVGEECRRGVVECDPKGGPDGTALVCVGLRVRDKNFCFNACNSSLSDENPDPDTDTRCGSSPRTQCFSLRQTNPNRPNGVCIKRCNSRAGDQEALLAECLSPTCGDGKLDFNETCDDGKKDNGDGCNQYCTLSTYERCDGQSDCRGSGQVCEEPVFGQGNTYCLAPTEVEKDEDEDDKKYRHTCMEFDYCWPPDERADWLGKKDEEVQP